MKNKNLKILPLPKDHKYIVPIIYKRKKVTAVSITLENIKAALRLLMK